MRTQDPAHSPARGRALRRCCRHLLSNADSRNNIDRGTVADREGRDGVEPLQTARSDPAGSGADTIAKGRVDRRLDVIGAEYLGLDPGELLIGKGL